MNEIVKDIASDTTNCKIVVNSLVAVYVERRGGRILDKAKDIFKQLKRQSKCLSKWSIRISRGGLVAIEEIQRKYPKTLDQLKKEKNAFKKYETQFKKWTFQSDEINNHLFLIPMNY